MPDNGAEPSPLAIHGFYPTHGQPQTCTTGRRRGHRMKASILDQVSEQYKAFCSLSRRDKITRVGLRLLCLSLVVASDIWLPQLYDSQPWIGLSFGALLFIHWMWHRGYPALKRRIAEWYREIATGGLRQVPGLCKRVY
jgi:hypothetical protein